MSFFDISEIIAQIVGKNALILMTVTVRHLVVYL